MDTKAKDVILIVEDSAVAQLLYKRVLQKRFPDKEIVIVSDVTSAIDVLTDPDRNVVSAVIDNGFPLVPGGERKGRSRTTDAVPDPSLIEKQNQANKEGGAGTMLVRFIRTGKIGAQTQETKDTIGDLDTLGESVIERYKELPIVWNSATPEAGKVEALKAASAGQDIDPTRPEFNDASVKIATGTVESLDAFTGATDKLSSTALANYIEAQLGRGMKPDPAGIQGPETQIQSPEPKRQTGIA